jgi:hypothetical protein
MEGIHYFYVVATEENKVMLKNEELIPQKV